MLELKPFGKLSYVEQREAAAVYVGKGLLIRVMTRQQETQVDSALEQLIDNAKEDVVMIGMSEGSVAAVQWVPRFYKSGETLYNRECGFTAVREFRQGIGTEFAEHRTRIFESLADIVPDVSSLAYEGSFDIAAVASRWGYQNLEQGNSGNRLMSVISYLRRLGRGKETSTDTGYRTQIYEAKNHSLTEAETRIRDAFLPILKPQTSENPSNIQYPDFVV